MGKKKEARRHRRFLIILNAFISRAEFIQTCGEILLLTLTQIFPEKSFFSLHNFHPAFKPKFMKKKSFTKKIFQSFPKSF
jgi:hypothetical protein